MLTKLHYLRKLQIYPATVACTIKHYELAQWKGSKRKQSARWQHVSRLKESAFCIWPNKLWWFKTQQFILGTGTSTWWVTEPHYLDCLFLTRLSSQCPML
jgi:hypothetical protein